MKEHHEHIHIDTEESTTPETTHPQHIEAREHFVEEGALTIETVDVVSEDVVTPHHARRSKKGFTLTTPMAIIIAAIIISGGLMGYGVITQGGDTTGVAKNVFAGRSIDDTDYITGKENSKVIVVEYSDPECPFCVQVSPTIKKLRADYGDRVAFVYRHFPLTQIHPHAFDESRAIACAGKIGGKEKFYEYIDTLFGYKMGKQTTQLPATGKEDTARGVGLDTRAFADCMTNKQTEQAVTDSLNDGIAAGVQGTPSTFVLLKTRKGYEVVSMVDGARPYEYFKTVLDQALSK